jgi:Ca-activated chloride channel family protein
MVLAGAARCCGVIGNVASLDAAASGRMSWGELLQLEWRAPAWALIALMPVLFNGLAGWRQQQWNRYAEPHLQPWALRQRVTSPQSVWRIGAVWSFWILLACALAGPRLPLEIRDNQHQTRHDMDIMIVLDVSASMAATDVAPNRLTRAKLKLQDLLGRLHGERLGLIVYAGEAGLLLPLTRDRQAFEQSLPLASDALFETRGSHLGAALALARDHLRDTKRSRAVLLISDIEASSLSGTAGSTAMQAARLLKTAGIPMYVLAMASDAGGAIPLAEGGMLQQDGIPIISRPDLASFQALVNLSGGYITPVSDSDSDLNALYERGLLTLPASAGGLDKTRTWRELFSYPLALALTLLLATYLRWPRRGVMAAAILATSGTTQADDAAWRAAHQAYVQKQYLVAQQSYRVLEGFHARMGEGAAAYRRKDYVYANRQFTQALLQAAHTSERADALFNLADSFFYAGNLLAAADAFEGVLHYRPDDAHAQENLARVRGKLRLQLSGVPSQGIPGRKGNGLGPNVNNAESPRSMAPVRDEIPLLQNANVADAADAKGLHAQVQKPPSALQADRRAALKKLDLLDDKRVQTFKQMLKQDATREPPSDMLPW